MCVAALNFLPRGDFISELGQEFKKKWEKNLESSAGFQWSLV